jgi:adenylate cyclase
VRTILQGSVLRAGNRVRINAELADGTTGANLWAQPFDRQLSDIFAVQDDIVRKIVTTLSLLLNLNDLKVPHGIALRPTDNLEAFDDVLRGAQYAWRLTKEGNSKARELDQKAVELDPKYADAYAGISVTYITPAIFKWSQNPQADLKRGAEFAQKALALDDSNLPALTQLVWVDVFELRSERAVADAERAVALNPNYAAGYDSLANALIFDGKPEEAIPNIEKAIRLDPESETYYIIELGLADLFMGRYAERLRPLKSTLPRIRIL